MPRKEITTDPYAPPPLKKDRTGAFVRGIIMVGLLAVGGAVAYTVMQSPPSQTASLEDQSKPQQLADGSYAANPAPQVAPPEAAPAPSEAPPAPRATTPRRSALRESAPVEDPAPIPVTPTPAPATPLPAQPLSPPDVGPSTSGGE